MLELRSELPLQNIINVKNENALLKDHSIYNTIGSNFFNINYKVIAPEISALKLSINGSSYKTIIANDSINCFYSIIKNFSIKYNDLDTSSIFCEVKDFYDNKPVPSEIPMSRAFVKKKNKLFFIAMSIQSDINALDSGLLYGLLK